MSLGPGSRLGPYDVIAPLGAGGMGEVYRARDTRLHRDVALKVLPDAFAADPERLARFEREAQALAALTHPHIAAIHGIEEKDGVRALVLELVDGETLAERLARGPLPVDEAIRLARQMAEALDAAHEQGIVHRDLKPGNVKITPDGNAKVLDFGLAKLTGPAEGGARPHPGAGVSRADLSLSPTMTSPALVTGAAVLLGTAGYMAPEQARGRSIDKRADIWAFGVVLYEMLTGRRAFDGESVTEVAGAVIHKEPDWRALPAATPPHVRLVLERCLQKDPKQRFRDIGDVRLALDGALVAVPPLSRPAPARRRVSELAGVAAVAALLAGAGVWLALRADRAPQSAVRFQVASPNRLELTPMIDISPDGRVISFLVPSAEGPRIWLHSLDSGAARAIPGDHITTRPTFWSPDGRYIGFWFANTLRRVAVSGGPAEAVAQPKNFGGGSWGRRDVIVFSGDEGIYRVEAGGGTPVKITAVDDARKESSHLLPSFLPDGEHFLYLRVSADPAMTGIYVGRTDASPEQQDTARVVATGQNAVYAPGDDPERGHLLFLRDGLLMAQPFDAGRRLLSGEAVPAMDRPVLVTNTQYASFSAAANRTLVFLRSVTPTGTVTLFDRTGRATPVPGAANLDGGTNPRLSPDGRRLAVLVAGDVWVYDLEGRPPIKLTFGGTSYSPIWTPDGQRIVFERAADDDEFSLYAVAADGSGGEPEPVAPAGHFHAQTWTPEGELVLSRIGGGTGDLLRVAARPDATPVPIQQTPANEGWSASVSPDGRWIAYDANSTGRMEIWVRPLAGGAPIRISPNSGSEPVWAKSGRELFYIEGDRLMAVQVSAGDRFTFSAPVPLFAVQAFLGGQPPIYDVTADGRFVMVKPDQATDLPIDVVLNFQAGLQARTGAN